MNLREINFDQAKMPLFVTWYKEVDSKYQLAGCIGTFSADGPDDYLTTMIREYSVIAATEDERFEPLIRQDMTKLKVGLSLLTNFSDEPLDDPTDWIVGKHGVELNITFKGKDYDGTFLPEVAEEEGWDQVETLCELLEKAEFPGTFEDAIKKMKITTYESVKTTLTYKEFLEQNP